MSSFNYALVPVESSNHEIRLVEILPDNEEPESTDPIAQSSGQADKSLRSRVHCRIMRVSLDDGALYTALSYAWGYSSDRGLIVVYDIEVSVNTSLESALYHLNHASASITLWADALCINESNHTEKTEAVQKMKRVFQDATQLIVWAWPERRGE
jgi:Heterokaryon incompatibility protein (HET)